MKWIVLVIAVYVVGYTFINFAYRKPAGSAHEPHAEARERGMRTVHATMNGWSRLICGFSHEMTSVSVGEAATVASQPLPKPLDRHLPPDLPPIMPGEPALHPATLVLTASAHSAAGEALRVQLEFSDDTTVPPFGETLAYVKDRHLYLFIQDPRHVAPDTPPTPATSPLALVVPGAALTPGTWQASAYTASQALTWSFTVD